MVLKSLRVRLHTTPVCFFLAVRAPEPETALDTGTQCPGQGKKALAYNGSRANSCCAFCMCRDILLLAHVLWY